MKSKYFHFLIISVLFSACSSQKIISSKWQKEAIKPISDIPRTDYQYLSDDKLFYLISNDDSCLYVNIKVDDQNVQRRLLMSGFTIWIDSSVKLQKYMGLKYQVDPNKMLMKPEELQKYLPLDENGEKISLMSYILKNIQQETIGISGNSDDISYHFALEDNNSLNFQMVLPIKYFASKQNTTPIISLILESKAPENMKQKPQSQRPQMGMANGGSESPGGGGRGGGKPGGKGGGENGAVREVQAEKVKDIEIKIKKLQLSSHE